MADGSEPPPGVRYRVPDPQALEAAKARAGALAAQEKARADELAARTAIMAIKAEKAKARADALAIKEKARAEKAMVQAKAFAAREAARAERLAVRALRVEQAAQAALHHKVRNRATCLWCGWSGALRQTRKITNHFYEPGNGTNPKCPGSGVLFEWIDGLWVSTQAPPPKGV